MDLSYLAVAAAVCQLEHVQRWSRAVSDALGRAAAGVERAGWRVCGRLDSPVRGARGAVEVFLHARRASRD
jgi:hypothetical protein